MNQVENSGDLTAIYILQNSQRLGIGKKLIKELFFKFEERGFKTIFVEVLEDNNSRYFNEAFGAERLKTEKIKMAGAELNLLVYEWRDISPILL